MRRVGVTYRCTKYDKMGYISRKLKEAVHNPEALKRNVRIPYCNVLSFLV